MYPILLKLIGGDRRSIGRSEEVVKDVLANAALFRPLISGLQSDDMVLRARVADAIEKITRHHPEYLRPYRTQLIGSFARITQKEVRWHIAQMLPRMRWIGGAQSQVLRTLSDYLSDDSSIVKTFAMQALADIAQQTPALLPQVKRRLQKLTATGTPAMRARGRKLLKRI